MRHGLAKTFIYLARTSNDAAGEALLELLKQPACPMRMHAVYSITQSKNIAAHTALIDFSPNFSPKENDLLRGIPHKMKNAFQEALAGENEARSKVACNLILKTNQYGMFPAVVTAVEKSANLSEHLLDTLVQLSRDYYQVFQETLLNPKKSSKYYLRSHIVNSLAKSVNRFEKHHCQEILLAYLSLTPTSHYFVKQLFSGEHSDLQKATLNLLRFSEHPNLILLSLDLICRAKPFPVLVSLVASRTDWGFIKALLQMIAKDTQGLIIRHLTHASYQAEWVTTSQDQILELDEQSQVAAVKLIAALEPQSKQFLPLCRAIISHGKTAAKLLIITLIQTSRSRENDALIIQLVRDNDPLVKAKAIAQLREREIKDSLPQLISYLDSPDEIVRKAAANSLPEFTFEKLVQLMDRLTEPKFSSTATIVRKVDASCVEQVERMLTSPVHIQRDRAIRLTEALDLTNEVAQSLIELLKLDESAPVRAQAATLLSKCGFSEVQEALTQALADRNHSVQEAARESLAIQQTTFSDFR